MAIDVGGAESMKHRDKHRATGTPAPSGKKDRKRLPRWADRLINMIVILIGVGLMVFFSILKLAKE